MNAPEEIAKLLTEDPDVFNEMDAYSRERERAMAQGENPVHWVLALRRQGMSTEEIVDELIEKFGPERAIEKFLPYFRTEELRETVAHLVIAWQRALMVQIAIRLNDVPAAAYIEAASPEFYPGRAVDEDANLVELVMPYIERGRGIPINVAWGPNPHSNAWDYFPEAQNQIIGAIQYFITLDPPGIDDVDVALNWYPEDVGDESDEVFTDLIAIIRETARLDQTS